MKSYRTLKSLLIGLSLLHLSYVPAKAAPKGLMGQVWPDREADRTDWNFEVSAETQGGGLLPDSPKTSYQDMYYFAADQDTIVSFIFTRTYYRAKRSPWVNVTSGLSDPYRIMPNMTLNRIRSQQNTASIQPKDSDAVFTKVSYSPQGADRARENLKQELEEQAELARASKTADIFQFNLEVYEDAYRDQPEAVKRGIAQFKGDAKYRDVSVAPPGRADLYKRMVLRDRGEKVVIDSDTLFNMANDNSLSPGIRQQSIKSMSVGTGEGTASNQRTLNFLRQNARDSSSKFHLAALTQLIKIGPQSDKEEILKTLESDDAQRIAPVLTAIEAARWNEGKDAVIKLSKNEKSSPAIKEVALETAAKLDKVGVRTNNIGYAEWRSRVFNLPTKTSSQKMVMTSIAARGTEADLKLIPRGGGVTGIVVNFRGLQTIDGNSNYILWGIDPGNNVVRLGQVSASPNRRDAQIGTETSLRSFSLFVTIEKDAVAARPAGLIVATAEEPGGD